ncbi:acetyltransferase [Rivularia sp. PCC 7116]|uniref:GNAT family N-acetyltransferase n=1 Tax=Rivularia sp. PCC 7116 TaxID=373994 RepID=UPI00029F1755|nr:GNAT family N-acetyltransferase [Rivularia sp. PCC 7116]AFY53203.1 acetyltransferase [Rivularia sp. PCC 7116]
MNTTTAIIRVAKLDDTDSIMSLADAVGLFEGEELEVLGDMLGGYFDGSLGEGHSWIVCDDGGVVGVGYFAPEQYAYGVYNLYFIAVHPKYQGKGYGTAMVKHVEKTLKEQGERLLLVETSGLPNFELTRKFYRKQGYEEEARIRDYYKPGDDKIIFRKAL